jgi:hypothetical protein
MLVTKTGKDNGIFLGFLALFIITFLLFRGDLFYTLIISVFILVIARALGGRWIWDMRVLDLTVPVMTVGVVAYLVVIILMLIRIVAMIA